MSPAEKQLTVRSLAVYHLDGLDPFHTPEFCDGINLIHGPNAAGKSRTATVIQALIWPELRPEYADISGNLESADERWYVRCDDRNARYQRNDQPADPPSLAGVSSEQKDRYLITLHQLLRDDNPHFAEAIQRESAGGYDLRRAREEAKLPTREPKVNPNRQRKAVQEAQGKTREARNEQELLRQSESSLSELRDQHKAAIAAGHRLALLKEAQAYAREAQALREAETELDRFPLQVGEMDGQEIEGLNEFRQAAQTFAERLDQANARLATAARKLDNASFESGLPDPGLVEQLQRHLRTIDALTTDRRNVLREVDQKAATADQRLKQIDERLTREQLEAIDHRQLEDLARLSLEAARVQVSAESMATLEAWLETTQPPTDLDQLREAVRLLNERLRIASQEESAAEETQTQYGLLAAAGVIIILAVTLALQTVPAAAAIGLSALPFVYLALRKHESPTAARARDIEEHYRTLGMQIPADWAPESVATLLDDVNRQRADSELAEARAIRWKDLESERVQTERQLHDLETKKAQRQEELGIQFDAEPESLRVLVDALIHWRESIDQLETAQIAAEAATASIESELAEINAILRQYGSTEAQGIAEAERLVDAFGKRVTTAHDAQAIIDRELLRISDEITPDLERAQSKITELFTRLDVQIDNDLELQRLVDMVDAHREAREQVNECLSRLDIVRTRLEDDPSLEYSDPSSLALELEEATQIASQQESILAEIVGIEHRVEQAKRASNIEEAIAAEDVAIEALRSAQQSDLERATGWELSEFIHSQTRDYNRPQVFTKAREFFSEFTSGEFRLEIDDGDTPQFTAVETSSNEHRSMTEISSGTRVQLLLAVRLAFIETLEQGVRLPLILDETLGISDDRRANAIIDATIEICRNGRQVIYFTAQPDEVAKWVSQVEANKQPVEYQVIDLAAVRGGSSRAQPAAFSLDREIFVSPEIPDDTDHAAARRLLQVPPIDPWDEQLGRVDLWYLIRNVPALVALRRTGISTWGQYQEMRKESLRGRVPDFDSVDQKAHQMAVALDAALRVWREGRARPLSARALLDSGSISDAFRSAVLALAAESDWDAEAIVEALRARQVARFNQQKADELEEYCRENGFISEVASTPDSAVRTEALLANSHAEDPPTDKEIEQLLHQISS